MKAIREREPLVDIAIDMGDGQWFDFTLSTATVVAFVKHRPPDEPALAFPVKVVVDKVLRAFDDACATKSESWSLAERRAALSAISSHISDALVGSDGSGRVPEWLE
jgi:hypothetical protein